CSAACARPPSSSSKPRVGATVRHRPRGGSMAGGIRKHIDGGALVVILMTLVLFVAALFEKGFSHDLLLEAGVFLVSVKLIIMSYKSARLSAELKGRLDEIH